ncbi:ABC-type phosphate transport system, permease component [Richelia intracellularis HH01]|uniref:ABC-type phosphate transport system, permease component n=1 Tax=Richelia intracellularis HH01 TaxID=1165094 RepID=M1WZ75_9NOST|nr:phosphate ABC transporter permease [Richelia intracellularis]CCH67342.1 ABC-type phosphate transport system, permease component [Richelia intracellularis HH01]
MLVPITRQKFEQLIPLVATASQYKYYWGKFPDILQRLLISVVSASIAVIVKTILGSKFDSILFLLGLIGSFYWLWAPVFWASICNVKCRRYKYSGFFQGRILDWWITDELMGQQETVNNQGELVIVENREKRINLEVGDETGFSTQVQAPLRVAYKAIAIGQKVEMLVMSNHTDLSRIEGISELFIPSRELWVNDYPYMRRDIFMEMSHHLRESPEMQTAKHRWHKRRSRD